ncbi:hypothetical protein Bca52824_027964 [Brassica carinata]|uniref:Ubiquitin-like protease family profile domain-containing protein n=1 Tax=Brassica carinata TaxID=52824 RepID=A0A8X7VBJ7_BRACI|nr:hypothetical protein Bca52824_027964 [Brassica carinata]
MVSSRLVDCPESPEEEEMGPIPDMMFEAGEEPVGVRVLTYQSSSALKRIFTALDAEEIEVIQRSSFGKLIDIAEKPVFSGRFARYLLSRQLKTKKKYEAWFRFAGKPVRFSLREFAIVTGLPCGKFPRKSKMKLKKTIVEKPYWPSLFGKVEVVTVADVIKMLYRKIVRDREIRIKYACLALLESVLLPTSSKMKISREHAEAIEDLEEFLSYPWGRVAFQMLIGSIKERDEIALSQNTIAIKGFALSLQLVMVEAVPSLTEIVQDICSSSESDSEDLERNGHDMFTKKQTLNPAHARNVDKKSDASVSSVLLDSPTHPIAVSSCLWSDEEEDAKVDSLVTRIRRNQEFTISSFRGGVGTSDVERMRQASTSKLKGRKAKKVLHYAQHPDPSNLADLVIEKLTPKLEFMDTNIRSACSTVAAIEGKVVVQVDALFAKFKEEMIKCVKDMVSATCQDFGGVHHGVSHIPTDVSNEAGGQPSRTTPAADVHRNTIQNVLSNISAYSTPPRVNHTSQKNLTANNKDHVESGFVCVTPFDEHCAHSATSGNRTRQNSFELNLDAHKRLDKKLMAEPSFSLGLTQEDQNQRSGNNEPPEIALRGTPDAMNVDANLEEGLGLGQSMARRREETGEGGSAGLVEDYQCGPHYVAARQARSFGIESVSEMERKYERLASKLSEKVVLNVGGLFVSGNDISLILDRSRFFQAKVIDIVIRVIRSSLAAAHALDGQRRVAFLDSKFVAAMNSMLPNFVRVEIKRHTCFQRIEGYYYFPCFLGNNHWVGICFDASEGVLTVLDCNIGLSKDNAVEKKLKPIVLMLPYLARFACQPVGDEPIIQCFDVVRPKSLEQINNPADSGLMALVLMGRHAVYGMEACKNISSDVLAEEGKRAAILTYEFKEEL